MVSLLSHASGLIGGRADERICMVGLPSTGFSSFLPVMAYSVGLERPFPTGRMLAELSTSLQAKLLKHQELQ